MVISAVVVFVVQRNVFHLSFIVAAHVRLSDQYGIFMHQRAVDFFSRHFNSYRLIYTKIIHFCIVYLRYSPLREHHIFPSFFYHDFNSKWIRTIWHGIRFYYSIKFQRSSLLAEVTFFLLSVGSDQLTHSVNWCSTFSIKTIVLPKIPNHWNWWKWNKITDFAGLQITFIFNVHTNI